ncbi:MAG: hypothetical protein A2W19_01735 [Spirochaetes bacterium RBG_16_49_21]|nr:MAG: hypothetical protein A2W19_01735 [Spirochaetes bacterium RBG_16_49_21]
MIPEKSIKLCDVAAILEAEVHYSYSRQLAIEIRTARASDLMSEILSDDQVPDMLLTRLCNAQVVRTASVFGIKAVIVVRGSHLSQKIIDLAVEENIVIMTTPGSLFTSCGKLYAHGVRGVLEIPQVQSENP